MPSAKEQRFLILAMGVMKAMRHSFFFKLFAAALDLLLQISILPQLGVLFIFTPHLLYCGGEGGVGVPCLCQTHLKFKKNNVHFNGPFSRLAQDRRFSSLYL